MKKEVVTEKNMGNLTWAEKTVDTVNGKKTFFETEGYGHIIQIFKNSRGETLGHMDGKLMSGDYHLYKTTTPWPIMWSEEELQTLAEAQLNKKLA